MTPQERSQFAAECNRRRKEGLLLSHSSTFGVKDEIKARGGIWDSSEKGWLLPDHPTLAYFLDGLNIKPTPTEPGSIKAATKRTDALLDGVVERIAATPIDSRPSRQPRLLEGPLAQALEESEMVIEARETELADIRFRLEALATALSACTKEQSFGLCRKVAIALTKMAYADKE